MTKAYARNDGASTDTPELVSRRDMTRFVTGGFLSLAVAGRSELRADTAAGSQSRLVEGKLASWRSHERMKRLEAAFQFLQRPDLAKMPLGRHVINEHAYATIDRSPSRPVESAEFEAHRKFIDVHYMISGQVMTGYAPVEQLKVHTPYKEKEDVAMYYVPSSYTKVNLYPGMFAVFFTGGGHMPNCHLDGRHELHKVVVKVAAESAV